MFIIDQKVLWKLVCKVKVISIEFLVKVGGICMVVFEIGGLDIVCMFKWWE